MNKLLNALFAIIVGTIAIGFVASTFYVFMNFAGATPEFIKYYGDSPVHALLKFILNPYHGDAFVNDDFYVRNVIFGISAAIMGVMAYTKL